MKDNEKFVEVSISTTAGFYPADGFNHLKADQPIQEELDKAAKKLKIKSTAGWVATVNDGAGKRPLDPARSYEQNNLSGQVEIDWGPSEGGGGRGAAG
jgi:hypothetical protein